MSNFINIDHEGQVLAIIIPAEFKKPAVHFVTPSEYSQQLAYMSHPKDKKITPHYHRHVVREVHYTQEVLVIRSGKLKVNFFDNDCNYLKSVILQKNDVIILASGGHGFEVLDDLVMVEIKQGPHIGEADKTRFEYNGHTNNILDIRKG